MGKEFVLYWLLFVVVRAVILTIIWHKYGWKAWGLAIMYALLSAISEVPEVG